MAEDKIYLHFLFQDEASGPASNTAEWRNEIMLIYTIRNLYSHNVMKPRLLDFIIDDDGIALTEFQSALY